MSPSNVKPVSLTLFRIPAGLRRERDRQTDRHTGRQTDKHTSKYETEIKNIRWTNVGEYWQCNSKYENAINT